MINTSLIFKFLDPRGQIGRFDFIKLSLFRSLILLVLWLISLRIKINVVGDPFYAVALLHIPLQGPITCRRANDIGLNCLWISPLLITFLLTWSNTSLTKDIWLLLKIHNIFIALLLIIFSGHKHKDWVRSKNHST